MAWFDETTVLQMFPSDFEKKLNENGWDTFIKYRAVAQNTGKGPGRIAFADVRLFKSLGSDGQIRTLGLATGHGVRKTPEMGAEEVISRHSILGEIDGAVDGHNLTFYTRLAPVQKDSLQLHLNDELYSGTYTVEDRTGKITLSAAPESGQALTASYIVHPNCPDPVTRAVLFTFEDVRGEQIVIGVSDTVIIGDPESILPDGDGVRKDFPIPTEAQIKEGTLRVYKNQVEQDPSTYTFDATTNTVKFSTAPPTGAELHTSFIKILKKTNDQQTQAYGDIPVKPFDPSKPEAVMHAVYSAMNYVYPSLPTVLSFTPLDTLNRSWQRDSSLYYWGNINCDRIALFFRPDPSANPENTFFAPLYVGRLMTAGKAPRKNHVLISGCREEDEIKWAVDKKIGKFYVDYGTNTSNGNSSVQLQQSIGGTYYQKHYLAFFTHDKTMDSGEARFNPSAYSGKYHISQMGIVHPNDGFVGKLDDCYAVHPKGISQLDELEVVEAAKGEVLGTGDGKKKVFHLNHTPLLDTLKIKVNCVETTAYQYDSTIKAIIFTSAPPQDAEVLAAYEYRELYRYTLADTPVTPFQLAAVSPYAPIGLGVLKETH